MKILLNPSYEDSESVRMLFFKNDILRELGSNTDYKLLDLGCSQLDFLNVPNIEAFGLDINHSKYYDNKHFKLCNLDIQKIPFKDNTFDFIIAGEILEHVKRPFELIEELSRVLKKEGFLYLSTPNPYYYLEILKELLGLKIIDDNDHLNLFSKIHLISYCEKQRLKLLEHRRYKFWVPFVKFMILSIHTPSLLNYQNIYKFVKK